MGALGTAPRLDLGLRGRARAWRSAFAGAALGTNLRAGGAALGLTVPLALLVAAQSGVPALWPMVSSIVGSAVVALFAGSPLVLAGPGVVTAAASALVIARHGPGGLALACAACGLLQVLAGGARLGRFAGVVPLPVVTAFVSALGAWVVLLALPHALGLNPATDLAALEVIDHLLAGGPRAAALVMAGLAAAATVAGRRFFPRLPVGLLVVAAATAVTAALHLSLPRLPDLPLALAAPPALALPSTQPLQFVGSVFMLWLLASAETLLSSVAEPERFAAPPPAPDQDLIGHGLANLAVAFLGGVPVTGAVIRAEAAPPGGRGVAVGLAHALWSVPALVVLLLADRFVPLAALAGVAIAHALPLLSPRPWRAILRASRGQAAILAVTAAVMVVRGLLAGVEIGVGLSLLAVLLRVGRLRVTVHRGEGGAQITFSGPVTFLASARLEALEAELGTLEPGGLLFDLRDVATMDLSGARRLVAMVAATIDRGQRVALLGVAPACRELLVGADRRALIETRLAVTEAEVDQILERSQSFELRAHVVASFERFREEVRERFTPLYQKLAEDQRPHTLFIGCVDSRVTPALLTGTHPGELFVVRCLGAIVVPPGGPVLGGEAAAIEYAVGVLGVRNIVVCGHSRCGAIRAISGGQMPPGLDSLARWLQSAGPAAGDLAAPDLDQAARQATVRQLENLRRFPQVRAAVEAGALELHAWFYDVGRADLHEWREDRQAFVAMGAPEATGSTSTSP